MRKRHDHAEGRNGGSACFAMATQNSLETQMEHERQAIAACGGSADFKEGVSAFLEKRSLSFQGR
jgi:enoyl-CoA hydratase/carnithine racemase